VTGADRGPCPQCVQPRSAELDVADHAFRRSFAQALEKAIADGNYFTVDELADRYGLITSKTHPNQIGALVLAAQRAGRIERVGDRRTTDPAGRGRRVSLWRGCAQ
jgi:hypothetical protein